MRRAFGFLLAFTLPTLPPWPGGGLTAAQAQPVTGIRYEVTFDAATARTRTLRVEMRFVAGGAGPVLLSLPSWTPGAYEESHFARNVRGFSASQNAVPLRWDKADYDTWRVNPVRAGEVTVAFEFLADSLDNAMAWSRPDFALFNGTNVFPYPEGLGFDFPATVRVRTEPGWRVATGMRPGGEPGVYREANYHDLVDMPFFVGRFDLDSLSIEGRTHRVASYPAGVFQGVPRQLLERQLQTVVPAMSRVFGETPWDSYTTLLMFVSSFGGGSALEHQNSHVGIYHPEFIGTPILTSITAHEIFHAWNVKRLRPADLFPYRYDGPQQTVWLWVSEGITDYYADLALLRGGVVDSAGFLELLREKHLEVETVPPVALEDASLSAWIQPSDGTASVYYPKGALAGLLLDILIRDASDNRRSLDDVMRTLYARAWKAGRGFTAEDWWTAVRQAAGGKSFEDFAARFVDGRDPFPWDAVLPLAGLRLAADSTREPRIGVSTTSDTAGTMVLEVVPGSMAADAGVRVGDFLLRLGEVAVAGEDFGLQYRRRYGREREGTPLGIRVAREGRELDLAGTLRFTVQVELRFEAASAAGEKARRVRDGIFRGRTTP
jgi:predicted metalloprotease with PDZ domain